MAAKVTPRDSPPVAVRFGKLPPGLPDWFVEFDSNSDGQVALYEWLRQKLPMDEFVAMDLDGDNLITPQELLRWMAEQAKERPAVAAPASGTPPKTAPTGRPGGAGNGP